MKTPAPREAILSLFRQTPDGFVSGERISDELGVSRTAVWKHIRNLRQAGYQIEAIPSRGYQLQQSPDVLMPEAIQSGLECQLVGSRIISLDEADSTNLQASRLGDEGADDGLVVIADRQTSGKGRMGRQWESPGGVNLYASILLRPPVLPFEAPKLTFLSAVAVCRAIKNCTGLQPTVKWPNDILLNGAKVAGLLNEMSSETDQVNYVVLGIGVNLNMRAEQFPEDLRYPATSLAIASGKAVSRLAFTRSLLQELDALYQLYLGEGSAPVFTAWTELCDLTGKRVQVDCNNLLIEGTMVGLGDDGALLVRTSAGKIESIYAGDVRPL
ncbi:biotin--[acetyl-CoA-carboxylase] ligase [Deltaproteobacteria bacterium IMCC39524]|nr:biotin--[acetyl-CoA-carboxylase] ligase [Deltaproteobacteria bacterium IMCC39524]